MTDIPEDVMKLADSLWQQLDYLGPKLAIARAILAEREAQRERDAKLCEAQKEAFLSPQYASNQPLGSLTERFACDECASAIRAA
jgi:hypothetical protein